MKKEREREFYIKKRLIKRKREIVDRERAIPS